ncbi:MAG: hypothetical protein JNL51_15395 [Chitinophagaceae bacterium]|nr:hypothetical protein [Chitinophagaceae bacterium]
MKKTLTFSILGLFALASSSFLASSLEQNNPLQGAWKSSSDAGEQVLIFQDGYVSYTSYDQGQKKFNYTYGGKTSFVNNALSIQVEFNSAKKDNVGKTLSTKAEVSGNKLTTHFNGLRQEWTRIDRGDKGLSGCWRINGRWDGSKMNPIKVGPRKTIKILSSTRFQWFAINTETKEFFGTGGGSYDFENGKYVEHIEFFSRDSARVGASLSFDADLKNGEWLHSGLSSKGDPIKETWVRDALKK